MIKAEVYAKPISVEAAELFFIRALFI